MDSIGIATMGKFTGPDILGTYTAPPPPKEEEHVFPKVHIKNVKTFTLNERKVEVKSVQEDD